MNRRITTRAATQPRRGLDHDEAAIYVGVTLATFDQMVNDGRLPKPTEFDGEFVWDLVQLDRAFQYPWELAWYLSLSFCLRTSTEHLLASGSLQNLSEMSD